MTLRAHFRLPGHATRSAILAATRGDGGMHARETIAARLRSVDLFAGLPDEALQSAAASVQVRRYRRGEPIFTEGDAGVAVHFVLSGRVKVFRRTADGVEHILRIWHPGETFAAIVLLRPTTYPASAEALEDAVVGRLPASDFERLANSFPALRARAGSVVADRVLSAQRKAEHMAREAGQARVMRALLEFAGPTAQESLVVAATHYDLAEATGLSRETVSRIMADLRRAGIVKPAGAGHLSLRVAELRAALQKQ